MIITLFLAAVLAQAATSAPDTKAPPVPNTQTTQTPQAESKPPVPKQDDEDPAALLKVKRIYVDSSGDDTISKQLQSMMVSALVESKRFKLTENREKADAVMKGVALEKTSQEIHAYGDSTAVGGAAGSHHSEISGSGGNISGSSSGGFIARHAGVSDSSLNTETINEARVAVRLVNPEGDVIWTSTQESKGAKYKGASADVAAKCVTQLLRDIDKVQRTTATPTSDSPKH